MRYLSGYLSRRGAAMPPPSTIFVMVVILLVAIGTVGMVVFKIAVWSSSRGVNRFADEEGAPTYHVRSQRMVFERPEREPPRSFDAPHMNHAEPDEPSFVNADELRLNA